MRKNTKLKMSMIAEAEVTHHPSQITPIIIDFIIYKFILIHDYDVLDERKIRSTEIEK